MANLLRRRSEASDVPSVAGGMFGGVDPWRMVRDLFNWDPFREVGGWPLERGMAFTAAFEVKERKDAYVFKADLPGIKEDELDISVTANRVTISGKREREEPAEGENYYVYERSYGQFTRTFTLPEGVDPEHIQAELREGVLTLVVPKKPEVQPKKIQLKAGSTAGREKMKA